jgi:hypothetical protein
MVSLLGKKHLQLTLAGRKTLCQYGLNCPARLSARTDVVFFCLWVRTTD